MTGTTATGGGLWKYILQADTENGLLRRNVPLMSQVLHFLDFSSIKLAGLQKWRDIGVRNRYNTDVTPSLQYSAPLFFDSGGFKLLWNQSIDLSNYGLSLKDGNGPRTILELQRDLGGDIVATLDYPLPPGLHTTEADERMQKSLNNAVAAAQYLQESEAYKPFLFVAVHGQDSAGMARYVQQVFGRLQENGLIEQPLGLAIGSLVPLRGSKKYPTIIELIRAAKNSIPQDRHSQVPIHTFGVTGNLVPILAYLGVDSFDSSTYVQEARSLGYIDPKSYMPTPVLELEEWKCECRICQRVTLNEIQEALVSDIHNRPLPNGNYKSKYYGDIALHNLEIDLQIVEETRQAIQADVLQDYVIQHSEKFPTLKTALDALALGDDSLRIRMTRTVVPAPEPLLQSPIPAQPLVSLNYTPEDFNILSNGYCPPAEKRILLIIPCSKGKPYSQSRSHRLIMERLNQAIGQRTREIHIVTLSGLYGPVPEEHENDAEILGYDFRLEPTNKAQIDLVTDRLVAYLERHREEYTAYLGYATSLAYRTVLEKTAHRIRNFDVLPRKPKNRKLTEFFRKDNIQELLEKASSSLNNCVDEGTAP